MIAKPIILGAITGEVFWLYPEFIMQRPYTRLSGPNVARLVLRSEIKKTLLSEYQSGVVAIIGDDMNTRYECAFLQQPKSRSWRHIGKAGRGRFYIGCMTFAAAQTKIIRKWAESQGCE